MTTALDVMKLALGELRVLKPGETPAPEESVDFVIRMNAALETWAVEGLMVYATTEETRVLTAGDYDISIGQSAADWTTDRPLRIIEAFLRDANGNDTPLTLIARDWYNAIVDKSPANSEPTHLYYNTTYPNGMIYLYPPPSSGYTLHLVSEKPFTAFTDENTSFSFPPGYLEFMGYNMAVRLAGPYNKALSPSTVALATQLKRNLEDRNAARSPIRGVVNVPAGNSGSINILTGE